MRKSYQEEQERSKSNVFPNNAENEKGFKNEFGAALPLKDLKSSAVLHTESSPGKPLFENLGTAPGTSPTHPQSSSIINGGYNQSIGTLDSNWVGKK